MLHKGKSTRFYTAPSERVQKCNNQASKGGEAAGRSRWHEVIIYPDEQDAEAIKARAKENWREWVGILHDLDVDQSTGEVKKAHYHLLLHSDNARTISAVARALKLPANRVESKANGEGAQAYLLHATERAVMEGKHRYPAEALEGPLAAQAAEAASRAQGGASESTQVVAILDFIEAYPPARKIGMAELARWAAASGYWASFRRAAIIFKGVIEEHNQAAEAAARRRKEDAEPLQVDPLRFARLRAGEIKEPRATVDMSLLEAVSS